MRTMRLLMVSVLAGACAAGAPEDAPGQRQGAVNQFRSVQQVLASSAGPSCAIAIDAESELLIRRLSVVEDPRRTTWTGSLADPTDGAWHFGRLMTAMAGPNDPEAFVRAWLA